MKKADVKKELGAAVRAHRLRLGLSQETLAQRAALHRTYVTDVERGARNISLESISRLADALDLSISSLFSDSPYPRRTGAIARSPSFGQTDILLVEDDSKDVELTLAAFDRARLSNYVHVVRDGEAALKFLFREDRRKPFRPSIVLLDLHLPKLHGLEVLKRLRADNRTRSARVVVLTSSRHDADMRAALDLGAEAFIVKPFDFETFSAITPRLNFSWTLLGTERRPSAETEAS